MPSWLSAQHSARSSVCRPDPAWTQPLYLCHRWRRMLLRWSLRSAILAYRTYSVGKAVFPIRLEGLTLSLLRNTVFCSRDSLCEALCCNDLEIGRMKRRREERKTASRTSTSTRLCNPTGHCHSAFINQPPRYLSCS